MKRRKFTAAFKLKVVLEALRGGETIRSIASRHGVHPGQVSKWKAEAHEGLLEVFARGEGKSAKRETEQLVERLYARIGELTAERGFLSRGCGAFRRAEKARLIRGVGTLSMSRKCELAGASRVEGRDDFAFELLRRARPPQFANSKNYSSSGDRCQNRISSIPTL